MSIVPCKLCPRCRVSAPLRAALCFHCGHVYRTHFALPAAFKCCPRCSVCAVITATKCLNCRHFYRTSITPHPASEI